MKSKNYFDPKQFFKVSFNAPLLLAIALVVILILYSLLGWFGDDSVNITHLSLNKATPQEIRAAIKQAERQRAERVRPLPASSKAAKVKALKAALAASKSADISQQITRNDGSRITVSAAAIVALNAGMVRGKITYPLYQGTLAGAGGHVYFVLSDSSDQDFAREFGVMYSGRLAEVNNSGVEDGTTLSRGGNWVFKQHPGLLPHRDENGQIRPGKSNSDYSSLKRIRWKNRDIIINAPFVKWGDQPGQQLIIDHGGCNPLIRRAPPNRFRLGSEAHIGGGPVGCEQEQALDRYLGGQALEITINNDKCPSAAPWTPCGWVTMKLQPTVHREDISPYLSIFNVSDAVVAEQLGVPHTPKLAMAGRSKESPALGLTGAPGSNSGVSSIVEFRNGIAARAGGPARFQPGAINYGVQSWSTYSPLLHVTWAFFDCLGGGKYFLKQRNESFGAIPKKGSEVQNFDPAVPMSFNPYAMNAEAMNCRDFVAKVSGSRDGIVYHEKLFTLWEKGNLVITESPPGWVVASNGGDIATPDHQSSMHLVINAPAPVSVIRD